MIMKERKRPCLCVVCKCGSIFAATVLSIEFPIDDEFLKDLENYAKEGYDIICKDASEFTLEPCTCN